MDKYETGSTFAGYTIKGLVAGGGMGQVYAATHEVYAVPVALKVLHPKLHKDSSWTKRFSVEGLVGTRLKHPNVLSAREMVSHDGRIALVMDLVQGGQTLEKVISREHRTGLGLVQALKVFLSIVQGIEYLHGKAIVHGDIKPENVLIEGDIRDADSWKPKVTDFGTVSLIADPVTIDGKPAVVATPRYASPEHLYGIDQVDEVSDIYSLGLVLHFILTGEHPSPAKNVEEAAKFVRQPLSVVALANFGDSLIELYKKACSREPVDRFQTARELALAVRGILDEHGAALELDDLQADLATEIDEEMAERQRQAEEEARSAAEAPADSGESPTQMATEIVGDAQPVSVEATTASGEPVAPDAQDMPFVDGEGVSPGDLVDGEVVGDAPSEEPAAESPAAAETQAEAAPGELAADEPARAPEPVASPPVPADTVDPNAPMPVWLWLVIGGGVAFLLLVAFMNWT